MKRSLIYTITLSALVLFSGALFSNRTLAQTANVAAGAGAPVDVNKVIQAFTAKETQFRRALNEYAFKREAIIQVIGMGGQVVSEYHRVSHFTFDNSGNRFEKIVYFPMPTFGGVTPEDIEDLGGVNPFALEANKLNQYNFTYVGKERIDELDLYIFDVAPKVVPDPKTKERLFVGRIWVDDHDLQIVKSRGKGVPETKVNKFPNVETYREQIDGLYWFPTYSYADEELVFGSGEVMHIRMKVTYKDFVKGHVDIKITEVDGDEVPNTPADGSASPQAKAPVMGGTLNGKALELPMPRFPEEARRARAHGIVKVRVTVDEEGKVSAAEAIEGPKELREAAVEAALKARFEPTRLHGQLIKITGVLVYNFETH
ncbi:MAG TPA: energy transducer TonB [Pyrinomonadaceae bacterium]|nr:energy transducer TonB [Pyrinomonadaceae bacterium]